MVRTRSMSAQIKAQEASQEEVRRSVSGQGTNQASGSGRQSGSNDSCARLDASLGARFNEDAMEKAR